jgi:transcriptional regulator with XRE-family HTH domain
MTIREYLEREDMRIRRLAVLAGCTREHLSRVAAGTAKPSKRLMDSLARVSDGAITKFGKASQWADQ